MSALKPTAHEFETWLTTPYGNATLWQEILNRTVQQPVKWWFWSVFGDIQKEVPLTYSVHNHQYRQLVGSDVVKLLWWVKENQNAVRARIRELVTPKD